MNKRVSRVVWSAAAGAIGAGVGLYAGWGAGPGVSLLLISANVPLSRETSALLIDSTRWLLLGLFVAVSLAVTAVRRNRARFVLLSVLGFALGGVVTSLLVVSSANRAGVVPSLAVPVGGAVAGLLMGLGAGLRSRSLVMALAAAIALVVGAQFIDPRSSALLPPPQRLSPAEWIALLVPGALIGAALAGLLPAEAEAAPAEA